LFIIEFQKLEPLSSKEPPLPASSKVSYLENQPIISLQACKRGYCLLALCIKMDPPWHLFFQAYPIPGNGVVKKSNT